MPMIIVGDALPVVAQFSFCLQRIGRSVNDHVISLRNGRQSAQETSEKRAKRKEILGAGRFEFVIMAARQNPSFKGHARSIRAEGDVVALRIDYALLLLFFLAQNVAKNAAVALAKPIARGAQFIKHAARNESGRGDLRMRMRPLLT